MQFEFTSTTIHIDTLKQAMVKGYQDRPTVYVYINRKGVLYTGISQQMRNRVYRHHVDSEWFKKASHVLAFQNDSWQLEDLYRMERQLIRVLGWFFAIHNKQHNGYARVIHMPLGSVQAELVRSIVAFMLQYLLLIIVLMVMLTFSTINKDDVSNWIRQTVQKILKGIKSCSRKLSQVQLPRLRSR
jgi:hypothetical protein